MRISIDDARVEEAIPTVAKQVPVELWVGSHRTSKRHKGTSYTVYMIC